MGWPKGVRRKGYRNGTMSKVLARSEPPVLGAVPMALTKTADRGQAIVLRAEKRAVSPYEEIGYSGLKQFSGILQEEFIQDLRGQKGARIYKEMGDNSADLGAFLQLVTRLIQQVVWNFAPWSDADGNSKEKHTEQAEWMNEALEDMEHSWAETLGEIVSMLRYGYAPMEVTMKVRRGWSNDPRKRSKFDDGLIGWRKMALRAQDSVYEWVYDDEERELVGLVQMPPPIYSRVQIPIDKLLNFRMDVERDNPEGRSIFRSAYQDYYLAKRLTAIAAIGAERNLAGIPVMYIPAEYMRSDASPAEKAVYTRARQIVENLRVDEQSGIVMPMQFDLDTQQQMYKLELLSVSTGKGGLDVDAMIKRHQTNMLRAVLADWMMLGTGDTGSWSLSSDRTDQFGVVLGGIMDIICGVMNRQAIPALARLNGWDLNELPYLEHGDVESPDLQKLADYISKLFSSGALTPDVELEDYLRETAHLPMRVETDEETGVESRTMPEKPQPGQPKPAAEEDVDETKPNPASDQEE